MSVYEIRSNRIEVEKHGYRDRFWLIGTGYIGCWFPATRRAGYADDRVDWMEKVSSRKAAAKLCLERYLATH